MSGEKRTEYARRAWLPVSWLQRELRPLDSLAALRNYGFVVGSQAQDAVVVGGAASLVAEFDKQEAKALPAFLAGTSKVGEYEPLRATLSHVGRCDDLGSLVLFGPGAGKDELEIAKQLVESVLRIRAERAEALDRLRELKSSQDALPELHSRVSARLEHEDLGDVVLSPVLERSGAHCAHLYFLPSQGAPELVGSRGRGAEPCPKLDAVVEEAIRELEDEPEQEVFRLDYSSSTQPGPGGFSTVIVVPLRFAGRLRGALCLGGRQPGKPTLQDARRTIRMSHELAWTLYLRGAFLASKRAGGTSSESFLNKAIVGVSAAVVQLRRDLVQAALCEAPVLLVGETGTGKELAAHVIHDLGSRRQQRFVAVDCASLVESLAESELFGYVRGAFTGAGADRPGLFEFASGGTVFLDEIASLADNLQGKLLRVLESSEVRRVGSNRATAIDVRPIAASNRDLLEASRKGEFRPDLYYRLEVYPVHLPPLRDRLEDIPCLVQHFLASERGQSSARRAASLHPAAMDRLQGYGWPGNVRELRNVIDRAAVRCTGPMIREADLQLGSSRYYAGGRPSLGQRLIEEITLHQCDFFESVARRLQERDITRTDAIEVIDWALEQGGGKFKKGAKFLNVADGEYQRWMDFIRYHRLHPARRDETPRGRR